MGSALVFGGGGQLGFAVAEHLLDHGWHCHVVTRGGRPLDSGLVDKGAVAVDGRDRARADIVATGGQTFDAVFDPTVYDDAAAADLLAGQSHFGSLVVVSSSSVYADGQGRTLDEAHQNGFPVFGGAITEDNATVPGGPQTYSTKKVAMEMVLVGCARPVTVLRPCAIYGKLSRHPREWWFIKRALDSREQIPITFRAESQFHTSSAAGIASLTRVCMEHPATRTLNVADPEVLTVRQIANAIGAAIGIEFNLLAFDAPAEPPAYVGSTPWSVERPFCVDTARARALGWDGGVAYEQAVKPVCDWLLEVTASDWREQFTGYSVYNRDVFDYAADDKVIARLTKD